MKKYGRNDKGCIEPMESIYSIVDGSPFACSEAKPVSLPYSEVKLKQQKVGDKPMYTEANINVTLPSETQRQYLIERLHQTYYDIYDDLGPKFGKQYSQKPRTLGEFLQRVQEKKFFVWNKDRVDIVPASDADDAFSVLLLGTLDIVWKDPSIKYDAEGLKKAIGELNDAKQEALDKLKIFDPKDGLEVLDTFKKWETTVVPDTKFPEKTA